MSTDDQAEDPMRSVEVIEPATMGPTQYHYGRDTATGLRVLFATRESGETEQLPIGDAETTYRRLTHPDAPIEPGEQAQYEEQLAVADIWEQLNELEAGIDEAIDGPSEADETEQDATLHQALDAAQRVEELLNHRSETREAAAADQDDAPAPVIAPAHEAAIEPAQIEL
ncbi:hypothetical protein [Streptomyces antimycoticus]|uniref:hypothetical protein n=1 Tax=Streptomyces antimycoticus TaxID=68175 RepID=UPI000A3A3B6F|nr:hypothetical protein [Streptomyces antimycoticus]